MKCPKCGSTRHQVKDSRPVDEYDYIRRRRFCFDCEHRWTTYEVDMSKEQIDELKAQFRKMIHDIDTVCVNLRTSLACMLEKIK